MRRAAGCAGLATLVGLAFAAPASASSVSASTDQVQFNAGAGEANNVTVSRVGDAISISDTGAPIVPGTGCSAAGPNQVTCPFPRFGFSASLGNLGDSFLADQSLSGIGFIQVSGEDGADSVTVAARAAQAVGISGDGFTDTPQPADGPDVIDAGPSSGFIVPGGGNDVVNGGDGNDQIAADQVADGADMISGGGDLDIYGAFTTRSADMQVTLDGAADDGIGCPGSGCEGDNVMPDVDSVVGGNGNDVLVGNGGPNTLVGGEGNDVVRGGGGPDSMSGSGGNDSLTGEAGPDQLMGGEGADRVDGGKGDDTFDSGQLIDDPDTIVGGKGEDLMDYSQANAGVRVSLDGRTGDGVPGENDNVGRDVEDVIGSAYADVLVGSAAANDLQGGGGADRLTGGKGLDGLIGGDGADRLTGGPGHDLLDSGDGPDRIKARDHRGDEIECGAALDRVKADRSDRLTADCDKVSRR
jgi:Ca2+-binding RTX toxin-like protein